MHTAPSRIERPEIEWPPARIVNGTPGSTGSTDRGCDIVGVAREGDGRRAAVDRSVPACASAVVVGVRRLDEPTDEAACSQC